LCVSKGNTGGAKMDAKTRDKISTWWVQTQSKI
jgi:hypothetical protein